MMLLNLGLLIFFLLLLIVAISRWKIHPFIALLLVAVAMGLSFGLGGKETIEVLLTGFSETLRWIAIIIIMGAFIGEVLQETGGAFRISDRIIKFAGEKNLPWAMGSTGYLISIPVFVDVAYILLQPVIESLAVKSRKPVLYIGLALIAGLMVSHTLIPPTPGPLAVASLLNVDLGRMLVINLIVAGFAMLGGIAWVLFYVKRAWIDYDNKLQKELAPEKEEVGDVTKKQSNILLDILPILVPILLIGMGSFLKLESGTYFSQVYTFLTIPLVAVFVGALIAVFQLKKEDRRTTISKLTERAILKSALVIMITGAGGSLGFVIKETGIQDQIVSYFSAYPFLGIMLPFIVSSLLTISTGSITVALVGTASMLAPIITTLPVSVEISAALIGCGSFCVIHANASLFWLLNRLHEVPPKILYQTLSIQSLIMGLSGLLGVVLLMLLGM